MLSTDKQTNRETDRQTDRQTDKLTNATKNITSFAKEVINENIVSLDRFKSKLKNRLEVEIYIIDSCGIHLNTKKILFIELYDSLCS